MSDNCGCGNPQEILKGMIYVGIILATLFIFPAYQHYRRWQKQRQLVRQWLWEAEKLRLMRYNMLQGYRGKE